MTLLALIPARGGSKGIPRKNIRSFCGKPLIHWSINAALAASSVDQVVVSTDDPEIADVAKSCGADVPFLRPVEYATDTASSIDVVLHALEALPYVSHVLLLQPTSPLRIVFDIESIVALHKQFSTSSAVSLTRSGKHPSWMYSLSQNNRLESLLKFDPVHCRQQLPPAYVVNGALYLASRDFLMSKRTFISTTTVGYVMPPERSVDIDSPLDWHWAEFLIGQKK